MAGQKPKSRGQPGTITEGITRISVAGFKSINQEQNIEIRPLTILAGANSSGKSSIMQPLLLLKQTLDVTYDPGALLLNGPNVSFTSAFQLLSRIGRKRRIERFHIGIEVGTEATVTTYFIRGKNKGFDVEQTLYDSEKEKHLLYIGIPKDEIRSILYATFATNLKGFLGKASLEIDAILTRNRCFLSLGVKLEDGSTFALPISSEVIVKEYIRKMIHLPGLRGNLERNYKATAAGPDFPGTFEYYVASVLEQWQIDEDSDKLEKLNRDLARLALTRNVITRRIDATQIELLVNRSVSSDKYEDLVNIADVGLGVSQALPVVVALRAANQGQLVYIEQPEIHLHPRAQFAMAEVLADAVLEGKRLVIETHSSLLLLGIQTLVAEGKLPPDLVKLHWFTLNDDGSTKIDSADLDQRGAYGDWPEDFDDIALYSEDRFINAQARMRGRKGE